MATRNGAARLIIGILSAILITGLTAWFTYGKNACSEEKVSEKIQKESPYIVDKKLIMDRLDRILRIEEQVSQIQTEQTKIGAKLDMVLREVQEP